MPKRVQGFFLLFFLSLSEASQTGQTVISPCILQRGPTATALCLSLYILIIFKQITYMTWSILIYTKCFIMLYFFTLLLMLYLQNNVYGLFKSIR